MQHANPVSLYITTQPTDQDRLRPLVRILLNLMLRKLCGKMAFADGKAVPNYKHRLLVMLDEFPALGKIPIMEQSLAFAAGWGIKFYLICQDINQLKSRETGYGPDELITSNCHVQTAFPPNRIETAEHLSRLTGTTTVVKEQVSTSGSRFSGLLSQTSRSMQEVQRPLLTPDECLRMPGPVKDSNSSSGLILEPGDMVVYSAGSPAIYGKQPLYFKDPIFLARAKIPPPSQTDKLRQARVIQQQDRITL
jgi:type IV secretion system protein VirD4